MELARLLKTIRKKYFLLLLLLGNLAESPR
nr:MAG TPA: hypothetical protein [Bacteriophage sp.]DAZ80738.1 MAG TPA: hypothetical protein [Caudoviricetes sp.]